jgi:hypothetical protein
MSEDTRPDIFKTLSEEELAKVEVPTPEQIREAIRKGQEDFQKCCRRHATYPRYR